MMIMTAGLLHEVTRVEGGSLLSLRLSLPSKCSKLVMNYKEREGEGERGGRWGMGEDQGTECAERLA